MQPRLLPLALVVLTLTLGASGLHSVADAAGSPSALQSHGNIRIIGDTGFTRSNGVLSGSGSQSDPYMIEGLDINASSENGIEINDTAAYFLIRNVYVHSGGGFTVGLLIYNVTNGVIEGSRFADSAAGIEVDHSANMTFANNLLSGDTGMSVGYSRRISILNNSVLSHYGVGLSFSFVTDSTVSGNMVSDGAHFSYGRYGVDTWNSSNMTIDANLVWNYEDGIRLSGYSVNILVSHNFAYQNILGVDSDYSGNITIGNNSLTGNEYGIGLYGTDYISGPNSFTVSGNIIANNTSYGIIVSYAPKTWILGNDIAQNYYPLLLSNTAASVYHNDFISNLNKTDVTQTSVSWDNGYPDGGNYWSDYTGVDNCSGPSQNTCTGPDGIGDTPEIVPSLETSVMVDRYPLIKPEPVNRPPVIVFQTTPHSMASNIPIVFDASASFDPDRGDFVQTVLWEFGDGTNASGTVVSHTYSDTGTYRVVVRAIDSHGFPAFAVQDLFVPRIPYLPGVAPGDWAAFSVESNILNYNLESFSINVTGVAGANVTYVWAERYHNGTTLTGERWVDLTTGFSFILIPSNLAAGDVLGSGNSEQITSTSSGSYLGIRRDTVVVDTSMSFYNSSGVWDQASGLLLQFNANNTTPYGLTYQRWNLINTNIWTPTGSLSVHITSVTPDPAETGATVTVGFAVSSSLPVTSITVNWGDGTTTHPSSTATFDRHTYLGTGGAQSDVFTINVTVTNGAGQRFALVNETVNDRAPTVTIVSVSPTSAGTGQIVRLNFTASDSDGTVSAIKLDWGDGSKPDLVLVVSSGSMCPASYCVLHPGALALIRWEDPNMISQGAIIAFTPLVSHPDYLVIHRVVEVIAADSQTGCTQLGFYTKGDANGVNDPWDTGCGIPASQVAGVYQSTLPAPIGNDTTAYDTHMYGSTGDSMTKTFTIRLTVTDNSGSEGSVTTSETINDRAPSVTISNLSPNPTNESRAVTVTFQASDPDGSIRSFSINWGDGTTIESLPSTAVSATHSYTSEGSFTVSITTTDNSGSTSQTTSTVTVNAPSSPPAPSPTILGVSPALFYSSVGGITAVIVILAALFVLRRKKTVV